MASSETNIVRRMKGNGSMMGRPGIFPEFIKIQTIKKTTFRIKKLKDPVLRLTSSANLSVIVLFF